MDIPGCPSNAAQCLSINMNQSQDLDARIRLTAPANPSRSHIPSFTTGDEIGGTIFVTAPRDVAFEELQVLLIGEQFAAVRGAVPDKAHHEFLRDVQTIDESLIPVPKLLKRGVKHDFPFRFLLADYLPISSCLHPVENPLVRAAHLHLPPSMGDASIAGFGGRLRDDFAPTGCRIVYSIQVVLRQANNFTNKREAILLTAQKIRVKPTSGDMPIPQLRLDAHDNDYTPRRDITTTREGSRLPLGQLSVVLHQPETIWLPLRDPLTEVIKSARLTLTYILANTAQSQATPEELPVLKSLQGHITATTLYTTTLSQTPSSFLSPKQRDLFGRPLNFCDKDIPLPIPSSPAVRWTSNSLLEPPPLAEMAAHPTYLKSNQVYYSASLLVPVSLGQENYIPTFHSCFISRLYSLCLKLDISQTGSATLKTIELRVPLVIAAKRDPGVLPSYNASLGVVHSHS